MNASSSRFMSRSRTDNTSATENATNGKSSALESSVTLGNPTLNEPTAHPPNNDTISSTTTSPANPKEQGTDKKNAQSRPGHEQQYEVAKDPTQARQFEPETSAAATQITDTVAPLRLRMKDLGENLISRFRHLIRNGRIEGSKVPVALDFDWRSLDTRIKSLRDH